MHSSFTSYQETLENQLFIFYGFTNLVPQAEGKQLPYRVILCNVTAEANSLLSRVPTICYLFPMIISRNPDIFMIETCSTEPSCRTYSQKSYKDTFPYDGFIITTIAKDGRYFRPLEAHPSYLFNYIKASSGSENGSDEICVCTKTRLNN